MYLQPNPLERARVGVAADDQLLGVGAQHEEAAAGVEGGRPDRLTVLVATDRHEVHSTRAGLRFAATARFTGQQLALSWGLRLVLKREHGRDVADLVLKIMML